MYVPKNDNVVNFASATGKMPPHNLEAEEAILGGILLDPNAIACVKNILKPHHFYLMAHTRIYDAALKLHLQEKPTDLLMVINHLKDNNLLEVIGGRNKMAFLVAHTVSARASSIGTKMYALRLIPVITIKFLPSSIPHSER
jgi:replicative DNA helicase